MGQRLQDLGIGFSESEHQTRLGQYCGFDLFGDLQDLQRLRITCSRVAHLMGQAFDGFNILCEHF